MFFIYFVTFLTAESYFAWGPCPTPSLQSGFTLSQYLGKWYDLVHASDFYWELGGQCDTALYSQSSTAGEITVVNSEYVNGEWKSNTGSATCQSSAPAHCAVKFFPLAPAGDYEVITTDYVNYSLVFSCANNGPGHDMWFWLLGRTPNYPTASFVPTIKALGFPDSEFKYTNQTGCPPQPNEFTVYH